VFVWGRAPSPVQAERGSITAFFADVAMGLDLVAR
jgi:hypothetical protein